jgi:Flp pilus assembly protein TadD
MTTEKRLVALARKPEAAGALFHLATLAIGRGSLDYAEAMLRRAITEAPTDPGLWNNLGVVLARTNRLNEAANAFASALGLKADYDDARANLEHSLHESPTAWRVTRMRVHHTARQGSIAA